MVETVDLTPDAVDADVNDDGVLALLYREQHGAMVRLAYLMTGSNAVAEDLVHDAFIRVHGRIEKVEQPVAYLRRAVVNGCRSWYRRKTVELRHRSDPQPDVEPPQIDETWQVLQDLSPRRRAAIVLRYYVGNSDAEIAEALGCSESNVRSLVFRGLNQLREVLSE